MAIDASDDLERVEPPLYQDRQKSRFSWVNVTVSYDYFGHDRHVVHTGPNCMHQPHCLIMEDLEDGTAACVCYCQPDYDLDKEGNIVVIHRDVPIRIEGVALIGTTGRNV